MQFLLANHLYEATIQGRSLEYRQAFDKAIVKRIKQGVVIDGDHPSRKIIAPPLPTIHPLRDTVAGKIGRGVVGIARALTGTGGTPEQIAEHRSSICFNCEHAVIALGVLSQCNLCSCSTWAKVRNADEKCPAKKWGPAKPKNDFFGRAIVVSLKSTPDRLKRFYQDFPGDWPFAWPEVFEAIQGDQTNTPAGWNWHDSNHAAAGCWLSWRAILKQAIDEKWDKPILVMEDDCQLLPGAASKITEAIGKLPDYWEIIFIGGEHHQHKPEIAPGLVRAIETGRTHCLAIHPRMFQWLYDFWGQTKWHVDRALRQVMHQRQCYAIDPWVAIQAESWSTLRNRQEPARAFDPRVVLPNGKRSQIFTHSGDVGDIIYSLPTIRAMARELGPATLFVHPVNWTRQRMTPGIVDQFKSLLELQPYIREVKLSESIEGFDLDGWRRMGFPGLYNIADRHLDLGGYAHHERENPWIDVEPLAVAKVVIARSPRYHNRTIPWRELVEKHRHEAVFVGMPDEHRAFCDEFGDISYHPTKDYLELARVISGAELFIGNQSSPTALRIAMCKPIIVERSTDPDNCHFDRPNAKYL